MLSAYAPALQDGGVDATILMPGYPDALARAANSEVVCTLEGLPGGDVELISANMPDTGIPVLLIKSDALYNRPGLYQDLNGAEWEDNAVRFATLSAVAVRIAQGLAGVRKVDLVHAHDWHAGLTPFYMKLAGVETPSVFTIHNLAFQGNYPLSFGPQLGIPAEMLEANPNSTNIEFYGQLSFMKAAICFADRITTVSETYAREILTPRFGHLMEGVLQANAKKLSGIMNGIDIDTWDPVHDPMIPRHFAVDEMRGKYACKRELQHVFGLPTDPFVPVLAIGSRLTWQKMGDVALDAIDSLMQTYSRLQVVVLGKGEIRLEQAMTRLAQRYPDRMSIHVGFDERRAHLLHAGADILLHGSRFEPCGLTPMYSMRYGTIPVASRVGGLADSIVDQGALNHPNDYRPAREASRASRTSAPRAATGFLFDGESAAAMTEATSRAIEAFMRPASWRTLQRNAMLADFTWQAAVGRYVAMYSALCGLPPARPVSKVRATVRRQVAANDRRERATGSSLAAMEQLMA
jgi:starch synthase